MIAKLRRLVPTVVAIVAILAMWEIAVRAGVVSEVAFPTMTDTMARLFEEVGDPSLWSAAAETLQGWALGLGIAMLVGIPLGLLIGSNNLLYRALRVPIEFLRPIPSVALIPLAVLLYGTGLQSKVFLAAFATVWPILIQAIYGVQDVDPVARDTARCFGLGRLERMYRVTLPSAVPYIATGVRVGSTVALILAVTAELVIGAPGLGRAINLARSGGSFELMYALIIATGLLGWTLNLAVTRVERRLLHWHPSHRVPAA